MGVKMSIFSMGQLEAILSQFNLDPKEVLVLPEIAFKEEPDLKHQWVDKLEIELSPEDLDVRLRISGLYCQEYACSYKDGGLWKPSKPLTERFEYEKLIKLKD